MNSPHPWWQQGIIYQIYPRSFQDSNADGIGDLPGILERLDYVASLNVDAVWISPIYPSPMVDFGYDVADYTGIHPMFGTMADFDRLLDAAHVRGLRIILDLVPNHTSHQHPWFIESRSSRDNPKRDWYIWRDPKPLPTSSDQEAGQVGDPPNNWLSAFGGPAWTFDERTGQYYLHQFCPEQPELNYRNPEVLEAMLDVMRFWLDKGVDGFRIDVITMMIKDEALRDNPPNPDWEEGGYPGDRLLPVYSRNQPEVHDIIREMRAVVDVYDDRVMIGETYFPNEMMDYYGENLDECHLPFNFDLIRTPWDARAVRASVDRYEAALPAGAWPNYVLGNHDQHRLATRAGQQQARVANMLLLTLRGTPTCYYGDEIGMHDVKIPPDKVQDPPAVNNPEAADEIGRDPERTPMQWDASPNAGFCPADVEPWLPVANDAAERNVAAQEDDPKSMLNFYRALAALRESEPALHGGAYAPVDVDDEELYVYTRTTPDADDFLIVLNFGDAPHTLDLSAVASYADVALATDMVREGSVDLLHLSLAPNEGLILRCGEMVL